MNKKIVGILIFYSICVNAKQVDLFDLLDDESGIVIETHQNISQANSVPSQSNEEDEADSNVSPCSLLDLLFKEDESEVVQAFPDKNEKYYRGQFKHIDLTYIDISAYDPHMSQEMQDSYKIDQEKLSPQEKEVVAKYYRLYQQCYEAPWYMKFVSKKVGYGIFAAADIEPGQLIGEYAGILYDQAIYESKPHNAKCCWTILPPSFMPDGKKSYVDSIESGNFTRMINHSYKPNVIPVTMHAPEGSRMLYVAAEKIKKDEQLLVNYGEGYWQQLGQPQELSR